MKPSALALAVLSALVLVLSAAATAAAAPVEIEAPASVEASQSAPYSVNVAARATRVDLYLDGERRWTATPRNRSFDRSGELSTAGLTPGRHSIRVTARIGRRVRVERRGFQVSSPQRDPWISDSNPAPSPSGSAAPNPKSPTATGSTKPPAPAPTPPPAEAPSGNLLFGSKFDGSFNGWYVQSLTGRATINPTAPFSGSGSGRFEVRQGDVEPDTGNSRSEVSGPTFNAGEDLYIRDMIRIPSTASYRGTWQIIQQLHETEWGGSPGIAVFLNADQTLQIGAGDGSPTYWKSSKVSTDQWHNLVYRVKLAKDPSQGFVEVWLDGTQQILLGGTPRMYGQTIQTARTYLKAGIYRGSASTGTSLIEHDNLAVGTSLSAVNGY